MNSKVTFPLQRIYFHFSRAHKLCQSFFCFFIEFSLFLCYNIKVFLQFYNKSKHNTLYYWRQREDSYSQRLNGYALETYLDRIASCESLIKKFLSLKETKLAARFIFIQIFYSEYFLFLILPQCY